jgi:hypothetical protein
MPLACDFIGFVNVTHVNLRKPDQQDEDHVAVDVKINGNLEGDVLAKLKGCQPVDVANNWFPEYQDEEQSPRFTNEVKTALNNEYKEHYLILDGHQFRANIKKMEYQVTKQKRIDLTFSATIDPVSEAEFCSWPACFRVMPSAALTTILICLPNRKPKMHWPRPYVNSRNNWSINNAVYLHHKN